MESSAAAAEANESAETKEEAAATGTYERTDDKITMKRQGADAVYVFELEGENLVFDREESSDIGLEDNAVFEPGY